MRSLRRSVGAQVRRHRQVAGALLLMVLLDRAGWLPRLVPREVPAAGCGAGASPYQWLILVTLLLALLEWLRRAWWEADQSTDRKS